MIAIRLVPDRSHVIATYSRRSDRDQMLIEASLTRSTEYNNIPDTGFTRKGCPAGILPAAPSSPLGNNPWSWTAVRDI